MRVVLMAAVGIVLGPTVQAAPFDYREETSPQAAQLVLSRDGRAWLSTQVTLFDRSTKERREQTYKVFTHAYDFTGDAPITKGPGGKYSHHRGLFIGWKDTLVGDSDYDTWHMSNCYQQHVQWLEQDARADKAAQSQLIRWCTLQDEAFIEEVRTISVSPGADGTRVIDFHSEFTALSGAISLRGDLQHAGMQVRMANEVSEHQQSTRYVLPEGAKELDNDKVVGAWWTCCSPVVRGKRYWIVHMTPQTHPTGVPVYSIRRYARFGAFFEPELTQGQALPLRFRVVVADTELDRAACAALYDAYATP